MQIVSITDESSAEEMASINHAAFGYRVQPCLSKYQAQQRIKNNQYSIYSTMHYERVKGFLIVNHKPKQFIKDPKEKSLENFSVLPWCQGKGYGKTILNYVINVVYPNDSFHLTVEITNKAVLLYEKFGFKSYGSNHIAINKYYTAMGLIRR